MSFPYTNVTGKIGTLFSKIREVGVPQKATVAWLKSIGFTSSNDASLLGLLKFIGFTDPTGVPTQTWTNYRGAEHKKVLGKAIREGYAELFAVYPNAHERSSDEVADVFSTSTTSGRQVVTLTVRTFSALVELADFSPTEQITDLSMPSSPLHGPALSPDDKVTRAPSLHIDVQVHISPEASSEQIEQVFSSMAKHLYGMRQTGE